MKTLIFSIAITTLSFGLSNAQTTEKLQLDEDARVDVQRSIVSKQLLQLRDSIGISIRVADILLQKAKIEAQKVTYGNAKNELIEYQKRVISDLDETSLTSENAWTGESEKRLKLSLNDTRREHNRIRKTILN